MDQLGNADSRIKLSDHFTYGRLIRFVAPCIVMMVFTSIYGLIDGLFVSNFVGKTPFAAVNLIIPFLMILGAIGFMVGTGGAAIVGKTLGEKKDDLANEYFSMFIYVLLVSGVLIFVLGFIFIKPVAMIIGARGELLEYALIYGRISLLSMPFFMLQQTFQEFFITAEKPKLGLYVTVISGVANIVFDALFIIVFHWGIVGAAAATAMSEFMGGAIPIVYFLRKNDSLLQLVKTKVRWRILGKACVNGCSEFVSSIASSVVAMIFNWQLLRIAGENGVAAYGVIMYVCFLFLAIFAGYQMGSAPLFSYNLGAENHAEMKNLFRKSVILMVGTGVIMVILPELLSVPLSKIFVGYDEELYLMTLRGLRIYVTAFILCGYNIFSSSLFTALNNGVISAIISFSRVVIFECGFVLVLPIFLGLDGVWMTFPCTEVATMIMASIFILKNRKRYHYL